MMSKNMLKKSLNGGNLVMNEVVKNGSWGSYSIEQLEKYGSDIQVTISDKMTEMLKETKCIDLEHTGKCLSDLSAETNHITKKLGGVKSLPSILKVSKWLARFDDVEGRIDSLESGIQAEKERLDTVLNGLHESLQFMRDRIIDLERCQAELEGAVEYFKNDPTDDGLKLQAAVNRLKIITTTIAVVKQECAKTVLIIKENKEVTNQLSEAADNLIPIFKVEMMNVIGAKTNAEAVKLKKNLAETANRIIVDNARQIEKTADDLIEGRTTTLIKVDTIQEANEIIQRAIEKVQKSATIEVQSNLESISQLQNSLGKINQLAMIDVSEE